MAREVWAYPFYIEASETNRLGVRFREAGNEVDAGGMLGVASHDGGFVSGSFLFLGEGRM